MGGIQIKSYTMAWDSKVKKGFVTIVLEGNNNEINVVVESAEEFDKLAKVLKELPTLLENNGLVHTGWEKHSK
jgi:hypothetical protein